MNSNYFPVMQYIITGEHTLSFHFEPDCVCVRAYLIIIVVIIINIQVKVPTQILKRE